MKRLNNSVPQLTERRKMWMCFFFVHFFRLSFLLSIWRIFGGTVVLSIVTVALLGLLPCYRALLSGPCRAPSCCFGSSKTFFVMSIIHGLGRVDGEGEKRKRSSVFLFPIFFFCDARIQRGPLTQCRISDINFMPYGAFWLTIINTICKLIKANSHTKTGNPATMQWPTVIVYILGKEQRHRNSMYAQKHARINGTFGFARNLRCINKSVRISEWGKRKYFSRWNGVSKFRFSYNCMALYGAHWWHANAWNWIESICLMLRNMCVVLAFTFKLFTSRYYISVCISCFNILRSLSKYRAEWLRLLLSDNLIGFVPILSLPFAVARCATNNQVERKKKCIV